MYSVLLSNFFLLHDDDYYYDNHKLLTFKFRFVFSQRTKQNDRDTKKTRETYGDDNHSENEC